MSATNIAEALYRVRLLQDLRPRGLIKDHAQAIEHELSADLIAAGLDPGTTPEAADALKLDLQRQPRHQPRPAAGSLQSALEQAAELSGSQSVWRELERFTHFCARMRLSKPGEALIADDKLLPVYVWCRASGRAPATDLAEAARLYLDWTAEALEQFRRRHESS